MISVIIPVYNVEKYLEKCIRSVLQNTYKDLEVICINDGSPDDCLEILKRFADEDARIKIIDQKNQGVQAARNNGLKAASGEYIAFVDSDDWIHPQYFQTLVECIEEKKADIVTCGAYKFYENDKISVSEYAHIPFRKVSGEQFFNNYYARHMCWGRLYRREYLEGVTFVPEVHSADDTLFNLRVLCNIENPESYVTDVPLYYYFQRSGSIVNSAKYEAFREFPEWVSIHYKTEQQYEWSWMLLMQAVKMALSFRYGAILHKDYKNTVYANKVLRKLFRMVKDTNMITRKDKMIHAIMIRFPGIYRWFRVKNDPSMKIWEMNVKEKISGSN